MFLVHKKSTEHHIVHLELTPVLLSTGENTVGVTVILQCGIISSESSSVGTTVSRLDPEIFNLEDAQEIFQIIRKELIAKSALHQEYIDHIIFNALGENENGIIGANLAVAISYAIAKAAAIYSRKPLFRYLSDRYQLKPSIPRIMCNIMGGGGHHENFLRITETMLIGPYDSVKENIKFVIKIKNRIAELLKERGYAFSVGLEGCLVPELVNDQESIQLINAAVNSISCNHNLQIGLDVAGNIDIDFLNQLLSVDEIQYIEDPFDIDDIENYLIARKRRPDILIAGDDLTGGKFHHLKEFLQKKYINAVVLKMNHWGTISRLYDAIKTIRLYDAKIILSQRSQETGSSIMSQLAVAFGVDFLKFGFPVRERIAVYNNLIFIEDVVNS